MRMVGNVTIVGALNVTHDSFYDGGKYILPADACARVGEMLQEGADIIEVGGQSTGPGSKEIPCTEELRRVLPTIEAIKETYPHTSVSVDTYRAEVAREALKRGIMMVNDVTAGRGDPAMFKVLAGSDAHIVVMYAKDPTPRTTVQEVQYNDVVTHIKEFLEQRVEVARGAGISREHIILDPGLGHFVSSLPEYSFEILARLQEFRDLGYPLFLSPSRKSFLAGSEKLAPSGRLAGTIAASAISVLHGALYIRTHDIASVRHGCEIAWNIRERMT